MVAILPKLFLKNKYTLTETHDRGIKKYKLNNDGYGIVYEPDVKIRKYIQQYVLINHDGEKQLQCKVSEKISYLDFDVVLFDRSNEVSQVIHVQDMVGKLGYTRSVSLPLETSYISILLNQVDDLVLKKESSVKISPFNLICFWVVGLILSVGVSFCIKWGFSYTFGGVFRESFVASSRGFAITLIIALITGAIGLSILTVSLILKNRKK